MDDLGHSILEAIKGCSLDCADWSADAQGDLAGVILRAVEASLGRMFLRSYGRAITVVYGEKPDGGISTGVSNSEHVWPCEEV